MSHAWIQGRRPPQTGTNGSKAGVRRRLGHQTGRVPFVEGGSKPFLSWATVRSAAENIQGFKDGACRRLGSLGEKICA